MKIHGSPTIGNPRRVAIFLAEKGLEIPFVPVDLYSLEHRGTAFLSKNPIGLVPVLELDDGTCVSETMTICRYLEELHPEPSILGRDPLDRAIRDMWQRRIEFGFYAAIRAYFRHSFEPARVLEPVQIAEWGELNRTLALDALRVLDAQLAENAFVAGPEFSAGDITLVMSLQGTAATGFRIPEDCVHVERWYAEVAQRPSVIGTSG